MVLINLLTLIRTQAVKQTLKASHRIHRMLGEDGNIHAFAFHSSTNNYLLLDTDSCAVVPYVQVLVGEGGERQHASVGVLYHHRTWHHAHAIILFSRYIRRGGILGRYIIYFIQPKKGVGTFLQDALSVQTNFSCILLFCMRLLVLYNCSSTVFPSSSIL